jgi:IS30 family transposase
MARPKANVDEEEVEKLAAMFCSLEEIASFFNVNTSTIQRRFAQAIGRGRNKGKISLKRKQYLVAMDGNVQMLIWLGKQHLDQKDKKEVSAEDGSNVIYMSYDPKKLKPSEAKS